MTDLTGKECDLICHLLVTTAIQPQHTPTVVDLIVKCETRKQQLNEEQENDGSKTENSG